MKINRNDYKASKVGDGPKGFYNTSVSIDDGRWYVGEAGVDSGTLIIIDPCYISRLPIAKEENWGEFCNLIAKNHHNPFEYGGGVVMSSGFGDGGFPVYTTFKDHTEVKHEVLTGHYTNDRDYDKSIGSHMKPKIFNYKHREWVELTHELRWKLNEYQTEAKRIEL